MGDLDDLARDLRQSAGRELRAEAAADEELTHIQRLRRMDLAGAAREAMHRGDRVAVAAPGITVSRPVVAVGDDYLTMEDDDRWIDVRLDGVVLDVAPQSSGGWSGRPAAATWRARMAELEQEQAKVELVLRSGGRREGRMEAVAVDHIRLAGDGGRAYVPLDVVLIVFSRFPPRRN